MNAFKCPKCKKSTMGWENYCVDCKEPLNIECPECGETWRYMFIYHYCPTCGHKLAPKGTDAVEKVGPANEITNIRIRRTKK